MSGFCMWRLRLTAGGGKGPVEPSGSFISDPVYVC